MPFWGSYVQGRVARADVCVVCVCVCVRLCVCNRFYSDTHSPPGALRSPPPPQHFLLENDKSSRPAGSQRRTGSPCSAVRREMMVRGCTHEHLGRSIWSSLIITVYYHLGWLWGGGSRRWMFGSIILSDQDWAGCARMGARLGSAQLTHTLLTVTLALALALAWAFRLTRPLRRFSPLTWPRKAIHRIPSHPPNPCTHA